MAARVFGGSANVDTPQPPRLVEVYWDKCESWALDVEVTGGPAVLLNVQTGVSQATISRQYRIETGRFLLPLSGDFIVVEVLPAETLAAPFARVVALLSLNPAINAPLGPSTARAGH